VKCEQGNKITLKYLSTVQIRFRCVIQHLMLDSHCPRVRVPVYGF